MRPRSYALIAVGLAAVAIGAFLVGRATRSEPPVADRAPVAASEPESRAIRGLSDAAELPGLRSEPQGSGSADSGVAAATGEPSASAPSPSAPAPSGGGSTGATPAPTGGLETGGGGTD